MVSLYETSYGDLVVAASKEGKLYCLKILEEEFSTEEVEILNILRGQCHTIELIETITVENKLVLVFPYIQNFLLKGFKDFWVYLNNVVEVKYTVCAS